MSIALYKYINFGGPEWTAMKTWLTEQKENKVNLLIAAPDQDTSNKIRGALSMIQQILALEESAKSTIGR